MNPNPARLALVSALLACSLAAPPAGAGTPDSLVTKSRTVRSTKGLRIRIDEGQLSVLERRGTAGRSIPIHFVRLFSTAAKPGTPVFFLAGGPGSPGTGAERDPTALDYWAPLLAVSDLVLIDQRGTRDPDLKWKWDGPLPMRFFADADSALAHEIEMSRRAVAAIRARGVDLAGYTTEESAQDLEALRLALGLPKISLLAFSYGTHLACAYLRRHADAVSDAVLVGCEGPDHTWKLPVTADTQFRRIATLASADTAISRRIPDLVELLDRVETRLRREPMNVTIPAPGNGEPLAVPVGAFGLRLFLRIDLGDASDIPVFPRLLWSIDRGDDSVLKWFLAKRAGVALSVHGMSFEMDAASGASAERLATIASQARASRWGDVMNFPFPDIVPAWDPPALPPDFHGPLTSTVRALFLSGALDSNSPPEQAIELRRGFPNSTHIVVQNAGHEQTLWQNPAALPLVAEFLLGRDVRGRTIDLPPLRFVPLEGRGREASHPSVE